MAKRWQVQPRSWGLADPHVDVSHGMDTELLSFPEHFGCTGPICCHDLDWEPAAKTLASLQASWLPVTGSDWLAGCEQQRHYHGSTACFASASALGHWLVLVLQQEDPMGWLLPLRWGGPASSRATHPHAAAVGSLHPSLFSSSSGLQNLGFPRLLESCELVLGKGVALRLVSWTPSPVSYPWPTGGFCFSS